MALFADVMPKLRRKKGWSLAKAAHEIGISEFVLAQVEKRYKLLNPYYLFKIADLFDYPFAELAIMNSLIDEYKNAEKVRRVFEYLEMEPGSWMHIKSVDELTVEQIEQMKISFKELGEGKEVSKKASGKFERKEEQL